MGKLSRRVLALLLAALAMFVVSACGSDDDSSSDSGSSGDQGGEITIGTTGPDNADPVMFQTTPGVQAFQLAYVPLITYAHEEGEAGASIIPGLATEVPSRRTAARRTSSSCARASSTATARPSRPATSRTRSSACSSRQRLVLLLQPASRAPTEFLKKSDCNGDISGIETDDKTGDDHDHADRAGHEDPVRPRRDRTGPDCRRRSRRARA